MAGCWEPDGRALIERMGAVGVNAEDVSSWTAVLLPLSRLGCADECLEVIDTYSRTPVPSLFVFVLFLYILCLEVGWVRCGVVGFRLGGLGSVG